MSSYLTIIALKETYTTPGNPSHTYYWLRILLSSFKSAAMDDINIRVPSVRILTRDLEVPSQTTGFELRQFASYELVNRKLGSHQKDSEVQNVEKSQRRISVRLLSITTTQIQIRAHITAGSSARAHPDLSGLLTFQ